jgi:hypothetical protein
MPPQFDLYQSARVNLSVAADSIDAQAGVIRGVAVITAGNLRPGDVRNFSIDRTTLVQVKECAEQYNGGLKVKMNHESGAGDIVGTLHNFRIEGDVLRADLHLLEHTKHRAYILEIAQKIPDTFGLSIAFSGPKEKAGERFLARCREIYSADIVDEPAANPSGLFSRRFDDWQKSKGHSPEQPQSMDNELLTKLGELIDSKLASVVTGFDAKISALETAQKNSLSKIEDVARLSNEAADRAALSAVKEFAKTLGQPAGAAAAPSAPAAAPVVEKFEELMKKHPKYPTSKTEALKDLMSKSPDAYRDYLARCQKGEVTMF